MNSDQLPDHIVAGIDHFDNHPATDGPVVFEDSNTGEYTFRSKVAKPSGATLVEAHGETVEVAWNRFEVAMSAQITAAAKESENPDIDEGG
jgi:hypothetical protein